MACKGQSKMKFCEQVTTNGLGHNGDVLFTLMTKTLHSVSAFIQTRSHCSTSALRVITNKLVSHTHSARSTKDNTDFLNITTHNNECTEHTS
jgi:hypothetical protein